MGFSLYKYQKQAIDFIMARHAAGLFLDMGMGKTLITLVALKKHLYEEFNVNKVLIIAPKETAKNTWTNEIAAWKSFACLKSVKVMGTTKERLTALNTKADIYITNRDQVTWLAEHYKNAWPFDCVVIDELSSFKSSKSNRFKALKRVRSKINYIIGLTGTPAPNSLIDLWAQVYLLDMGNSLGRTITSYRDIYFTPGRRNGAIVYDYKLLPDSEFKIYAKLEPLCISMKAEDYLELPERIEKDIKIKLDPSILDQYKTLERDYLLPFADGDIDAVNAATLFGKLHQLASGAVYTEEHTVKIFHSAKLDALEAILEKVGDESVLVFYYYKHELERLMAKYPDAINVKAPGAIDAWNAGKAKILLAHPASAGHGLNLQRGGRICVWLTLPTSLELYQQANKRLHRLGQTKPVLIYTILAEGTCDIRVKDVLLASKERTQAALLDALKAHIKEVI